MASSLTNYQIVLLLILGLNLLFWLMIICWRLMFIDGISRATRRIGQSFRSIFSPPSQRANRDSENGPNARRPSSELPPPYEEAIKYPSISSLLSASTNIIASSSGITNHTCICMSIETINQQLTSQRQPAAGPSVTQNDLSVSTSDVTSRKQIAIRSLSCNDLQAAMSKTAASPASSSPSSASSSPSSSSTPPPAFDQVIVNT
ncbi:hypothetical protein HDE_08850 [Halotydeus destructor]|nr:hypothetical protein HDE_08850 [Halotydeus destructor]